MLVYIYDEKTKEFLREEEAHLDPLETKIKGESIYLLPAFATFEKPLDKEDGKAVIFSESSWKLVDDNRGKFTIKDGVMQEITTLDPVEKVLTNEDVEGLNNGTLIIVNDEIIEKPTPTKEEVSQIRRQLYIEQKDPITCQIQALKDEPQTEEIISEIETLKAERAEIVAKIKEENPYPEELTETKASGVVPDSQMEQLELPLYV